MATDGLLGAEVLNVSANGEAVTTSLGEVDGDRPVRGMPARTIRSVAGQRHYPGLFWSATTGGHVWYESLLELDRLWLADFDPQVAWISSQPFGLAGRDGDAVRRHVPDYLLRRRDGSVVVVDVKPARLAEVLHWAEVLDWADRLVAARGWRYEVWTGADPIFMTNVKFLSQGRRRSRVDPTAIRALAAAGAPGMTLAQAQYVAHETAHVPAVDLRVAMLALLWRQVWAVDLGVPLGGSTTIDEIREVASAV